MNSAIKKTVESTDSQYNEIDNNRSPKNRSFLWIICGVIAAFVIVAAATNGYISPRPVTTSTFKAELRGSADVDSSDYKLLPGSIPNDPAFNSVVKTDGQEDQPSGPLNPKKAASKSSHTFTTFMETTNDKKVLPGSVENDPAFSDYVKTDGKEDQPSGPLNPKSKSSSRKSGNPAATTTTTTTTSSEEARGSSISAADLTAYVKELKIERQEQKAENQEKKKEDAEQIAEDEAELAKEIEEMNERNAEIAEQKAEGEAERAEEEAEKEEELAEKQAEIAEEKAEKAAEVAAEKAAKADEMAAAKAAKAAAIAEEKAEKKAEQKEENKEQNEEKEEEEEEEEEEKEKEEKEKAERAGKMTDEKVKVAKNGKRNANNKPPPEH